MSVRSEEHPTSHAATRSRTHKKLESNHAVHHFPARESKGLVWKGWVGRMKSSLEGWNGSRVDGGKGMKCSLLTRILFSPAFAWAFQLYWTCFCNWKTTGFVWTKAKRIYRYNFVNCFVQLHAYLTVEDGRKLNYSDCFCLCNGTPFVLVTTICSVWRPYLSVGYHVGTSLRELVHVLRRNWC